MRLYPTKHFVREYTKLSQQLQKKTDKALKFLLQNLRHPSLGVKKVKEIYFFSIFAIARYMMKKEEFGKRE